MVQRGPLLERAFLQGHFGRCPNDGTYAKAFSRILSEPEPDYSGSPEKILQQYDIRSENTGESIESDLKIAYLLEHYPDISLFVQTIPAFCCPSLVTEAMAGRIERKTGVPIVSITYDGTGGNPNDAIVPYLKYPRSVNQRSRRHCHGHFSGKAIVDEVPAVHQRNPRTLKLKKP